MSSFDSSRWKNLLCALNPIYSESRLPIETCRAIESTCGKDLPMSNISANIHNWNFLLNNGKMEFSIEMYRLFLHFFLYHLWVVWNIYDFYTQVFCYWLISLSIFRCMKLVQHPHVVRLYEVIDTQTKLYLILELGDGGDLYDYIMKHEGGLSEHLAREYFRQIVQAISYCHKLHVVHR